MQAGNEMFYGGGPLEQHPFRSNMFNLYDQVMASGVSAAPEMSTQFGTLLPSASQMEASTPGVPRIGSPSVLGNHPQWDADGTHR